MKIKIMSALTIIFSVLACVSMIAFFASNNGTPYKDMVTQLGLMVAFIACAGICGSAVDAMRRR